MSHVSRQLAVAEQWFPREELTSTPLVIDRRSITTIENKKPVFPSQRPSPDLELQNYALLKIRHQLEQELERYIDLYDFAPIGYMAITRDATIQKINLEGAILLGVARSYLINRPFDEFVSTETLSTFKAFLQRVKHGTNRESCEIILNLKDWPSVRLEGVGLGATGDWLCQIVMLDMTRQRLAEEALRHSEESSRRIIEMVREGVWQVDAQGLVTFANARMAEILGYTIEELLGQPLFDETIFMDKVWRERAKVGGENGGYGTVEQHDIQFRRKDGEVIWIRVSINSIFDSQGCYSGALGMTIDMTDHKSMKEESRYLSKIDPLTGLFHRQHFLAVAEQEFERSQHDQQPLAAVALDIPQFKLIYDTFGPGVGDQVLQMVARVMRSTLRRADLLGRYGGEKFVMLLPETALPLAMATAKRLNVALTAEPMVTDKGMFTVTASMGVAALIHQVGASLEELLDGANRALDEAKRSGRHQVQAWPGANGVWAPLRTDGVV